MKQWYYCPVCGQKLLMVEPSKKFEGVYIKCIGWLIFFAGGIKMYDELEEIRHEEEAMKQAIPAWEMDEYDDVAKSLARRKLELMFGGEKNDIRSNRA